MAQRRTVVVLDDDPTGTQCARDVPVLVDPEADVVTALDRAGGPLYVLTNTRAMPSADAVALLAGLRDRITQACARAGRTPEFVLRGDSTLRGHVFAESDVFGGRDAVLLFVPAFPEGGRTTVGGVHRVLIDGRPTPVADTEFAADPVFGYTARTMVDWVREVGDRDGMTVPRGAPEVLVEALMRAAPGTVVVPDVVDHADLAAVSAALDRTRAAGREVVLRCAATLAAMRAGRLADGLLPTPVRARTDGPVLVVCGSHTAASGRQLDRLCGRLGLPARYLDTETALRDPVAAARSVIPALLADLRERDIAVLASARRRRPEHDLLEHGASVMAGLRTAVAELAPAVRAVITKGGITAAEVARSGFGAARARALGPVLPGVPLWRLATPATDTIVQAVVPGNVGDDDTLVAVGRAFAIM
jgi:uncharacterized protein YgbK (DUF1537 family)